MDKVCEYCKVLKPIVHCKADSANLCLQCDLKIHSANSLSNRHSRTLLCESCRCHWAYLQCSNHQMFMCRSCDCSQHNVSSQHQRRVISSYIGCPSAMDLAALWGIDLEGWDYNNHHDHFLTTSSTSVDKGASSRNMLLQPCSEGSLTSHSGVECEVGLRRKHYKAYHKGRLQENNCLIMQQILDLHWLQQTDESNTSSFVHSQEQTVLSSPEEFHNFNLKNKIDQHFLGLDSEFQHMGSRNQDLHVDSFSMSFSQLDQLTSSSIGESTLHGAIGESTLHGDSIWQCKSPVQSGQLWSKTMQDLGVCEELEYLDELNMPDIDLTFQNFEELFRGGEQEPRGELLNDSSKQCATSEKDISSDKLEDDFSSGMEESALPQRRKPKELSEEATKTKRR